MRRIWYMSGKNLSALRGECTSLADSPCIGWCTVRQFGDKRCNGCGRHDYECDSTYWNALPDWKKKLINLRNAGDGYQIKHIKGNSRPIPRIVVNNTKPKDHPETKY